MKRFLLTVLIVLQVYANAGMHSDVLVYGATPGGFCAAIAAARAGVSVISAG
jgi:NADPH-dependent 2,4-dienoyl-CoA reductase/sulfur reductase-like enzyme